MPTSNSSVLLAVSAPPFWHCGRTVRSSSYNTLIALIPVVLLAFWHWGFPALRVMSLACMTGVAVEALCLFLMKRDICIDDFSAVVTCLLFSMLLPANAPWWLVIIGASLCITLGKMSFGGLGANPVNSALVGWALLFVSWPVFMDPNAMQLNTDLIDPLVQLKYFGAESVKDISIFDLLFGYQIGALGAAQSIAIIIGGIYLLVRGVVRYEITLSFIIGVAVVAGIFYDIDSTKYASPIFHLLSGSTLLGAFFIATEAASSPDRRIPMIIYGLIGGALVVIIRVYGIYTDGVPFAILLINLLTPLLDSIRPKPFGGK